MFSKLEILIIIFILLIVFYFVIATGAGGKREKFQSREIKNYLFGVRALIILIAAVSLILWLFL